MDYRINKLKLQANAGVRKQSGVRKHTAQRIAKRWLDNIPITGLSTIQEEGKFKGSTPNLSAPHEIDVVSVRDENHNPNLLPESPYQSPIYPVIDNKSPGCLKSISDRSDEARSSPSCLSSSECGEEEPEITQLRDWIIENNVADELVDGLLPILRRRLLPGVPSTARALLSAALATSSSIAQSDGTRSKESSPRSSFGSDERGKGSWCFLSRVR